MSKTRVINLPEKADLSSSELDVDTLLQQGGEILKREIRNLMIESTGKKLSPTSARDLVAYVRLLHELREEQKDSAGALTDEELKAALSDAASPAKL